MTLFFLPARVSENFSKLRDKKRQETARIRAVDNPVLNQRFSTESRIMASIAAGQMSPSRALYTRLPRAKQQG